MVSESADKYSNEDLQAQLMLIPIVSSKQDINDIGSGHYEIYGFLRAFFARRRRRKTLF